MGDTDSTKRWISREYSEGENTGTMAAFLDHLRSEQTYSGPLPGEICCAYIPETVTTWEEISTRLIKDPDHRRQAEIREMWEKELQEKREKQHEMEPPRLELIPITAPGFTTTASEPLFHTRYFTTRTERLLHHFQFILTLPTPEDKVMCYTSMTEYDTLTEYDTGTFFMTRPLVAHVTAFDDLQARADDTIMTGYAIAHDLLSDDILIGKFSEVKKKHCGYHCRLYRLYSGELWSENLTRGLFPLASVDCPLVFRGSPAKLAKHILDSGSFDGVGDEFGDLIQYIASEWILLNANAIKRVQSPAEHRDTFTDALHLQLQTYHANVLLDALSSRSLPSVLREG